jgi:hypothetical protein
MKGIHVIPREVVKLEACGSPEFIEAICAQVSRLEVKYDQQVDWCISSIDVLPVPELGETTESFFEATRRLSDQAKVREF